MPKAEELKYTKTHEWLSFEDNIAIVGISEHAQHEMGDIVFVELPKINQKLEKGKPCAIVESVKSAFDVYAPISGEVLSINENITKEPGTINQSPLENGWFFKMKVSNPDEAKDLMDFQAYTEFIKQGRG